ncbi:hypothetical protein ACFUEM_38500 [Streptomyces anulatus]
MGGLARYDDEVFAADRERQYIDSTEEHGGLEKVSDRCAEPGGSGFFF